MYFRQETGIFCLEKIVLEQKQTDKHLMVIKSLVFDQYQGRNCQLVT